MPSQNDTATAEPATESELHFHVGRGGSRIPGDFSEAAAQKAAEALNAGSVKDWFAYRCPLTYPSGLSQPKP